jgi:hypothetical protein
MFYHNRALRPKTYSVDSRQLRFDEAFEA